MAEKEEILEHGDGNGKGKGDEGGRVRRVTRNSPVLFIFYPGDLRIFQKHNDDVGGTLVP